MLDELSESVHESFNSHVQKCDICTASQNSMPEGLCPEGRALWQKIQDWHEEENEV